MLTDVIGRRDSLRERRLTRRLLDRVFPARRESRIRKQFIADFFSSDEYRKYVSEFRSGGVNGIVQSASEQYRKMVGDEQLSGIGLETGQQYYAIVRKLQPSVLVETGVCNGVSTLCILLALNENETGQLHSIDFPYRADEPLDEFRSKTFEKYGGAAIPSDKEPGWIIPDELRNRWSLTIGKSQRKLPALLTQFDEIDFFAHDSEHSVPCMMYEFELAWEWLAPDGILIADDISWNNSFELFTEHRECNPGLITPNVGYCRK